MPSSNACKPRAERRRTLTILDETTDFIGSTDLQGNFLYLNLAARHLLGIAADADVSRRDLSELHPASAMDIVTRIGIPTAVRQGMWTGETTLRRVGGDEVVVSQLIVAHRGRNGEVEYLSTVMRDLTEQKQAEQALRLREQSLRMAQHVGNLGSWERDLVADQLSWSEQMFRLLGRDAQTFEVTPASWLSVVHPDDLARAVARSRRCGRGPARDLDRSSHRAARRRAALTCTLVRKS